MKQEPTSEYVAQFSAWGDNAYETALYMLNTTQAQFSD